MSLMSKKHSQGNQQQQQQQKKPLQKSPWMFAHLALTSQI